MVHQPAASPSHAQPQAAEAASAVAVEEARSQLAAAKASYDAVLAGLRQQEAELLDRVAELSRQVSKGQDISTRSAAELEAATAALQAAQQKLAAAEAEAAANKERAGALQAEVRALVAANVDVCTQWVGCSRNAPCRSAYVWLLTSSVFIRTRAVIGFSD